MHWKLAGFGFQVPSSEQKDCFQSRPCDIQKPENNFNFLSTLDNSKLKVRRRIKPREQVYLIDEEYFQTSPWRVENRTKGGGEHLIAFKDIKRIFKFLNLL